jgi:aspartate dehydrogenase
MRLGLVGCGSIGSAVMAAIAEGTLESLEVIGITATRWNKTTEAIAATLKCRVWKDVAPLIHLQPDLVLEAASPDAVRRFAAGILSSGADLMVVSAGALADPPFLSSLIRLAKENGSRLLVPSGAIGGLDIIKAAICGGLEECRLTTTKPPRALSASPYCRERNINLDMIHEATLIFEGNACQAIRGFPHNLNVAATISLAGLGFERTMVRIIADPAVVCNIHEVFVRGSFGEATVRLVNQPSFDNPKSSYLASLSVIAALRSASQQLQLVS